MVVENGSVSVFERSRRANDSMADFRNVEDRLDDFGLDPMLNVNLPDNQRFHIKESTLIFHGLTLAKHTIVVAGVNYPQTYDVTQSVFEKLNSKFPLEDQHELLMTPEILLARFDIKRVDLRRLKKLLRERG